MPAVIFNLWNPYRCEDGSLTFEVTQADTFRLHHGSRELVTAALAALGVAAQAASWQITPGRSLYYSDDPEAPDWRDRWPRTWRVKVAFETPPPARTNKLFRQR